ncbi:sulfatase-like hydrolase/transferase [Cytophagaceae bacterium SJW1-29]|uniref:Sulfatase-like hydrolase/transferase n=1 Tax=Salmonirosea aquatica TaxID=2654236 RepID=A0A7C9FPP3_9BACT|nr:sulfatase-like hydrolase/transferase [Cytophagaceae bacterium SJW1-29]
MRLHFLRLASVFLFPCSILSAQAQPPPNVILVITDDQGYGDLGITGNPHVRTPVIDKFAKESVRFNRFYVSPVCAPTRSSLMTGRYSLRTGVRDTYNGGAMMAPTEITIAEMLKQANYTTGIFGKWHLGDNYPSRPNDQGFDESLIHLSGGMGQVGDVTTYFKGDSSYFNPTLWHNGKQQAYQGYCSDIFAAGALDFIEKNQKRPFFCYLSFNAPHTPLQVPDAYYQHYKNIDPASGFEKDDRPFVKMSEANKEDARKVYAMVENIDDNLGKLFQKLDELNLTENTLVIFMTDNGPQQVRYVAGMRGRKGSVYQGGVRVPFYVRYPTRFVGNKDIDTPAAHIDVLPTLAELCKVPLPKDCKIDGHSLLPLIEGKSVPWANRSLFFYWSRRYPELYNNVALQKAPYKLVGHTDYNAEITRFELFDLEKDPYEQKNLVNEKTAVARQLKIELDGLFQELVNSENMLHPPRIEVGTPQENPVILNRNDADGDLGIWAQEEIYGLWRVRVHEGRYTIRFKFIEPVPGNGQMILETKPFINQIKQPGTPNDLIEMKDVHLPDMEGDLIPYYSVGSRKIFPFWVEIEKIK